MGTGAGLTGAATVIGIGHTAITGIAPIGAAGIGIGPTAITGTTVLTGAAGMDTGITVTGAATAGIGATGAAGNRQPVWRAHKAATAY